MSRPCRSSPWAALGSGAAAYGVIQIKLKQRLLPDTDLLESYCAEHEKDSYHLEGKQVFLGLHAFPARFWLTTITISRRARVAWTRSSHKVASIPTAV